MTRVIERATARLLGPALRAATADSARRFTRALEAPERAQAERLAAILRGVSGTRQSRGIAGFERIRAAREFQDAVPLRTPDELTADVEAIARGERSVLWRDRVLRFERSGGTSGASKHVPHTAALLREFQAALLPWLNDLAASRPACCRGPGYWAISPLAREREVTPGGIPVGADDAAYFPAPMRGLLARIFAVPSSVAGLPDIASCRYATLRLLIACPDLALVSVWSPSFLLLLLEALDTHAGRLIDDLAAGRCRPPALTMENGGAREAGREARIESIVAGLPLRADPARARALRALLDARGALQPASVWPALALISTWTDAQARRALPALRDRFPGVPFQGKGLLATEGVVSLPLERAPAPVLAVRSHFFEFLDPERPQERPRLAHEIEPGRLYEIAMSTGAGFLRYRLGDLVRIEGHLGRTPCLRFEGRADAVSDLVGEKLSSARAGVVIAAACAAFDLAPRFAMLAPEWGAPPAYHLYLETGAGDETLAAVARRAEALLSEGFGYRYARELGQLGPVRAVRVHDGARHYEARCLALGQRAGDIKPVDLDVRPGWLPWTSDAAAASEPLVTT